MLGYLIGSQKVRILFTLYQIMSPMALNLGVRMPPRFTRWLSSFDFVNVSKGSHPHCQLCCELPDASDLTSCSIVRHLLPARSRSSFFLI